MASKSSIQVQFWNLSDWLAPYEHMAPIDFNGIPLQTTDSQLSPSKYNIYKRYIICPECPLGTVTLNCSGNRTQNKIILH
jgi:hypothetical protein